MNEKFDRNVRFFGLEGQEAIAGTTVCVLGVGGLGTHIVQQLVYAGVRNFNVIDPETFDVTNANRYVGSIYEDIENETPKVDIAERIILSVCPDACVNKLQKSAVSEEAFNLIKKSDVVIGCFDDDGPRFVINQLCCAYEIPYIDLASDIHAGDDLIYGGRVITVHDDKSCIMCIEDLDQEEIHRSLNNPVVTKLKDDLYGIDKKLLGEKGPSVVFVNGVIASLAVKEFIAIVTKIAEPNRYLNYRGDLARITKRNERQAKDCFCCNVLRGLKEKADIERYIRKLLSETA